MNFNFKYIITGGPGFGKTSIIDALALRGYNTVPEISRGIIKKELETGGDVLPWKNLETFSRLVFEKRILQYKEFENHLSPTFFDRGIPDVVAYMEKDEIELPEKYTKALVEFQYNNIVFITPPWKDIFLNDNERKENFNEAVEIQKFIEKTYTTLGYKLIEIPKFSIEERVEFIVENLK
jgi:predicted ATPase